VAEVASNQSRGQEGDYLDKLPYHKISVCKPRGLDDEGQSGIQPVVRYRHRNPFVN